MTEHSLTTGEKLPMATQSSPEVLQSLDLIVLVLLVSRYLFALLGLAFFLWEGAEVFWMNEDLTLAVIEVALISLLGPVLVWVSTGWALRLARDAGRTHRQIQHEIAERRRTQDELQESEERFRRLVENAWDAFFLHDLDGEFVDVNQRACDSLGYTRQELLGLSVSDVEVNFGQDRIGDSWGQMIPKTPVTREGVHKRRDGSVFPVEVRSGLLESGGHPLFLALARDVTERKHAEGALRESERRIKELAAATVRAHEEERQWAAIEVHDRISQPLAGVVHELQTLESITNTDPQAREVAQRASVLLQEAIRECRNIMDALYPAGLDEFGLVALLDAELDLFERDTGCCAQLDNNLSVVVPKDVGVVLYRIFHEALNNIRRHAASANNVIVSVAYEAQAVSLYVQDDGPGFDVEAAMDGQRVSGLISMSRRAEIIGGTCEIECAPGQGTTVKVHVPIDASDL